MPMFNGIFTREYYLNRIKGFIKSDIIKVITGIRRCGKSSFLKSIVNYLEENGVKTKDIIYINLDEKGYRYIKTDTQLEKMIDSYVTDSNYKYLLIDEIQNVKNFEPLINSYRETGNFSVFITGSNSYLLSGELVTKLTGRYIEIEMFTLTFKEYLDMKKFYNKPINNNLYQELEEYITYGGFPKPLEFDDVKDKELYIKDVIDQIIKKDIKKHNKIKNLFVFEKVLTYIINNFGATTNLENIKRYFNNVAHIPIKQETLYKYINIIENAKILYRCNRFDLKSKKSLKGEQKYYLADLSIYYSRNIDKRINYGPALENIIYTYLTSRGFDLSIGKMGNLECDFITKDIDRYYYIQVAMSITNDETMEREFNVFAKIKDNYPKYLFTIDPLPQTKDGIIHKNIINFITNNESL
mgnify:CR=1 FL=1